MAPASLRLHVLLAFAMCAAVMGKVTIGYGPKFTIPIPVGTLDSLPYFNKASAAHAKSGGTLTIGPGTFIFSNQWRLTVNNAKIQGAGIGKTILKLRNFAEPFKSAGMIVSTKTKNVTMTDLSVDGNKKNQDSKNPKTLYGRYCIFIAGYRDWTFRRVECHNFQEYGFDPHGIKKQIKGKFDRKTAISSYGLIIEDCTSHDNNWDGITVDQTEDVIIRNNTAYNNGRHGINIVTASSRVLVEGNRVWNNGQKPPLGFGCGLLADTNREGFTTNNVIFRKNNVTGQGATGGACVKGAEDILFEGNTIKNSITCATFIKSGKGVKFIKNTCIANKKDFAFQQGGVPPTLSGNVFKA